ncbi:Gluconokinase [Oenococcus oeni]|uniref:gluconokinase n=2 Tax=Oenococcus oeni TaxID=1247 RepID=UPI0010B0A428|nr:gluconokinase [Oenococcus oeni]SYW12224.1 Gluconokinase [Oenococcus oeni]
MNYYIGIDIGTTSTKVVFYNQSAKIISTATRLYPLYHDLPDEAEEDPDQIFESVINCLAEVIKKAQVNVKDIKAVSFSVQQHSLMAVDKNGKPLTRLFTWADNRSEKFVGNFQKTAAAKELFQRTGVPTHPMAPIFKLMWLKESDPDLYNRTSYWIGIKEYIFYKLFGKWVEDYSVASSTGLLNEKALDWDEAALKMTGISRKQLPKLMSSTDKIIGIREEYALKTGLSRKTAFVLGASDGSMANVGVGAIDEGTLAITIGTSAAIRSIVNEPLFDSKARVYCYPLLPKEKWIIGGPINNGGIVFRWVRDQLFDNITEKGLKNQDPYDYLTNLASKVPAGSHGLIFLPYLEGERAPIWDANARGTFFGLNESHTRADMVRAVLEGIVYNIYAVMITMREVTGNTKNIMATGGFARSELWCQMMADIFETKVSVPASFESGCLGAMVMAQIGVGEAQDLSIVKKFIGSVKTFNPNPNNFRRYRELMEIFISITRNLSKDFTRISDFQREFQN